MSQPPPPDAPSHAGTSHAGASSSGAHSGSHASGHVAHHVAEFGEVDKLVHIPAADAHADETVPLPPVSRKDRLAKRERVSRLTRRLFAGRHLMQYFHNETLYRTEGNRSIGPDELFLDLIIVGGIAALGHELREFYSGWRDVEKFFLLFAAIYSGWRSLVFLWNLFDVHSDLVDKIGIYITFFCLTGIALGAHGAFDDGIRPYVATCAFAATAIPSISLLSWSWREPLLKNPNNVVNQLTLTSALTIISALPYLAAAFAGEDRARALFWAPFGLQLAFLLTSGPLYRFLHRKRTGHSRLAVAIELMVEKYEVLTMIVLGESVLGILFEGALVVTDENARVNALYAAAAAGTAMLYALQTLYVNVDGTIIKGGRHAIRYRAFNGIVWGQMHTFYHFALVLFATGLGISLRDITIPSKSDSVAAEAVRWVVRAGDAVESATGAKFGRKERWLFSGGWGASLILSGLLGAVHDVGPRAATHLPRLVVRFAVVIAIMVGIPFADISAGDFLIAYTVPTVLIAVVEFVLHHMDRIGFFRSEHTIYSSTDGMKPSDSFEDEEADDDESPRAPEDVLSAENQEAAAKEMLEKALQQRLRRRHCSRLVPVQTRPSEAEEENPKGEEQQAV